MKLYKFRKLATDTDLDRLKSIIETGCFWCSNFWDLNDPMEGIFRTFYDPKRSLKIFDEKSTFKICSFSGENGLDNTILWGYYANGFKGVAIEIEVENDNENIKKIKYLSRPDLTKDQTDDVIKILTKKSNAWKHEAEFRFLVKSENNHHKIGKITKVYFGNPYGDSSNRPDICNKSEKLRTYDKLANSLKEICIGKKVDYMDYSSSIIIKPEDNYGKTAAKN